jgi:hypothetical protein
MKTQLHIVYRHHPEYAACGLFTEHWRHQPTDLGSNPAFDPKAADRFAKVTASLEADNYYATHTREECRAEWAARYEKESNYDNSTK